MSEILLILSAPSGTGKTTLARRLVAAHAGAIFSVSYTTRAPRPGERENVDYHFVDDAKFDAMIQAGEFVEWAPVHGHRYGTPRSVIVEAQRRNALAVFGTAIPYLFLFWLLPRIPVAAIGAIPLLDTTFAVFLGTAVLHEPLEATLLAGGALVLCGAALANFAGAGRLETLPESG